jgi:hypothetical protein
MKRGPFPMWPAFPAPSTTTRSDCRSAAPPLPGFAGYRRASLPGPRRRRRRDGSPSSQDDHPHVQHPIRRRVPRRPLLDQERLPWPSPWTNRLGPLSRPDGTGLLDDARSGFTRVADRAVASAPLRTRPLDHARKLRYRGPRRLPEPDSHRQAAPNLSLAMSCRTPTSMAPSSLGAPVHLGSDADLEQGLADARFVGVCEPVPGH